MPGRGGKKKGCRRPRAREEAPVRGEDQRYARVTTLLGNGRATVMCDDGIERRCKIRGSMRRREWVHVGETVLVCLRTDLSGSSVRRAEDVGDIVHRYLPEELARLARLGEPVQVAADEDPEDQFVTFDHADDDVDAI